MIFVVDRTVKKPPLISEVEPNRKRPNQRFWDFDQTDSNRTDKTIGRMALLLAFLYHILICIIKWAVHQCLYMSAIEGIYF